MILCAIVAVAENGVIGRNNDLPWKIPEDLRRFKSTTMGKIIIMGRKTFESLERPLKGRTNVVVTRQADFAVENIEVCKSLEEALVWADKHSAPLDEVFIIGGEEIYRQSWDRIQRLYLTRVLKNFEGDRYFPSFDLENEFKIISKEKYTQTEPEALECEFIVAERI